jgi:hypothetical protein
MPPESSIESFSISDYELLRSVRVAFAFAFVFAFALFLWPKSPHVTRTTSAVSPEEQTRTDPFSGG